MYTMGLDIGSTATKGVIIKNGSDIMATAVIFSGVGLTASSDVVNEMFESLKCTRKDIDKLVVTGYGRMKYQGSDKQISELSCHTKGVKFLVPSVRTIIDIGGQDMKVIKVDVDGSLLNFTMNDKCAAGTGRFLEVMAKVLGVNVNDLGELSKKARQKVQISNTCTVFAESEVISHLSNEVSVEDIIAGISISVATKVASLARRVGIVNDVVMVGGVAKNSGIVSALEMELGGKIIVPQFVQHTGALGAALYAFEEKQKRQNGIGGRKWARN